MRSSTTVRVFADDAQQLCFVDGDYVIRAFSPNTSDHALAVTVLPRGSPGTDDLIELKNIYALDELISKDSISIPVDESRVYVPRQRVRELCHPAGGRMLGDRDVEYSASAVIEDDEYVQERESDRRNNHEVHSDRFVHVISDEGAPGLRWRFVFP